MFSSNRTVDSRSFHFRPLCFKFASVFFGILGFRFWFLSEAVCFVPFWDQWVGETNLYITDICETFSFRDLFAIHNEHRIFTTKLIAYVFYILDHTWDPRRMVIMSSVVAALDAAIIFHLLTRIHVRWHEQVIFLACLIFIFGFPMNPFGLLSGFQIQFYLLILFSITGLSLLFSNDRCYFRIFGAFILIALAFLSSGGGVLTLVASIGLVSLSSTKLSVPKGVFIVIAVSLLFVALTSGGDHIQGRSGRYFSYGIGFSIEILMTCLSWPLKLNILSPFLLLGIFSIQFVVSFKKRVLKAQNALGLSMIVIALLVALSVAVTRGYFLHSRGIVIDRYTEILSLGVLFSLQFVFIFINSRPELKTRIGKIEISSLISGIIGIGVILSFLYPLLFHSLPKFREYASLRDSIELEFIDLVTQENWTPWKERTELLCDECQSGDFSRFNSSVYEYSIYPDHILFFESYPHLLKYMFRYLIPNQDDVELEQKDITQLLATESILMMILSGSFFLFYIYRRNDKEWIHSGYE